MIVSAAIKLTDGTILTGKTHEAISKLAQAKGCIKGYFKNHKRGYITHRGEFLDREQAGRHAFECKQIKRLTTYLKDENLVKQDQHPYYNGI